MPLGANFWSRTGGPLMWRNCSPQVVREGLRVRFEHGLRQTVPSPTGPTSCPTPDSVEAKVEHFADFLDVQGDRHAVAPDPSSWGTYPALRDHRQHREAETAAARTGGVRRYPVHCRLRPLRAHRRAGGPGGDRVPGARVPVQPDDDLPLIFSSLQQAYVAARCCQEDGRRFVWLVGQHDQEAAVTPLASGYSLHDLETGEELSKIPLPAYGVRVVELRAE